MRFLLSSLLFSVLAAGVAGAGAGALPGFAPSPGAPLVYNLSTRDARLAGPVWSIAKTVGGEMVVGANKLMIFDGAKWDEIEGVPGYAFRALVTASDGTVWVGGTGQLGFLARSQTGHWHFTSLLGEARAAGFALPEEIWHIAATPDGIVFVAPQQVLRWKEGKFEVWTLPAAPRLLAHTIAGEIFVHQPGMGLLHIGPQGPVRVRAQTDMPEGLILWAVAPASAGKESTPNGLPDGAVVGTNDGTFLVTGGTFERLPELSAAIAGQLPTCAVMLDEATLAVGTYQRGILVASLRNGRINRFLDRGAGLPDDRVNRLLVDTEGQLWAGLSVGLARIETAQSASLFDQRHGLADGPVRQIFAQGPELFAATSKTLYRFSPDHPTNTGAPLQALPPLNTFVWDTATVGREVFVGGFGGIWRMDLSEEPSRKPDASWVHEHHVSADVFRLIASKYLAGTLFFFEGHALKALQRTERSWVPRTLISDVGDTPVSLIEDSGGDIWVSLMVKGAKRYRVIDDIDGLPISLRLVQNFEPGNGLPSSSVRPRLSRLGNQVIAFTESAILATPDDREGEPFSPVRELVGWVGIAAAADEDNAWWILQGRELGRFGIPALFTVRPGGRPDSIASEPLNAPGLEQLGSITSLGLQPASAQPVLWIGGTHALLRIEPTPAGPPPEVHLQQVRSGDRLVALRPGDHAMPSLPGSQGIAFRVFSPVATREPVLLQTFLQGAEGDWSSLQSDAGRTFVGLAPGNYTFQARGVDRWGRAGPPLSYPFSIKTPWWQTAPAIAAYIIVALALIGAGVWWRLHQLHRRTQELNRLVEIRTRELATANAAKTEFLESISHEIRNPLNGILGLVPMLRELAPGSQMQGLTQPLLACSKALTRVFNDVLNFSKLAHGQVALREAPFLLSSLVEEVTALFRVTAQAHGRSITIHRSGEPLQHFVGDSEKIETILSNFISNALKYAPGSNVDIHVQCDAVDDFGATVTFNITDHGPGIAPEEQEEIFQQFVRGSAARRQRASGTGLGLATCRSLAELLGGHVAVESEPGRGSTFYLTLRLKRDRNPRPVGEIPPPHPAGRASLALIVEDQSYNRLVVQRIAEQLGYEPHVARDGTDALTKLAAHRYDLVLLDWELPDLPGDEVARRIRQSPGGPDMIILATTAHDSEEIRRQGTAAGMDGFALKPFDAGIISQLIAEVRQQRSRPGGELEPELNFRVFGYLGYDDPEEAVRSARLYLELLDQELAALRSALAQGSAINAAQSAHRLKSHAGMIGARSLRDEAERLQQAANTGTEVDDAAIREFAKAVRLRLLAWMDSAAIRTRE